MGLPPLSAQMFSSNMTVALSILMIIFAVVITLVSCFCLTAFCRRRSENITTKPIKNGSEVGSLSFRSREDSVVMGVPVDVTAEVND